MRLSEQQPAPQITIFRRGPSGVFTAKWRQLNSRAISACLARLLLSTGSNSSKDGSGDNQGVIPLEDLVPRKDPKGGKAGSGKPAFGGGPVISGPEGPDRQAKKGRREK